MARYPPLHIDIPPSALQARHLEHKDPGSESPGYFRPQHDSGFTFTMSSSQYLASPCSDIVSSPMITPVPCKMQAPYVSASPTNRDDKRGRGGAFDLQTGAKTGSSYQSYLNQSFTQLRQQRLQEQQQQRSKLKTQQSYVSKYSSYTSSSQNMIRSDNIGSVKPSTTQALFMTEKEKLASPYSPCYSSRESLASPPPPYFHPDQRDTLPVDQTPITPALVAPNKRNSLPTPSPSPMSSTLPINPVARNAKELKRHSLPPSSAGLQWPSAMTMAVAAVTRPKLAKTMPPQATPVICGGDSNSSLPLSTPTALFIPRTTRMAEKSEVDTLYSCRISEDEHSTSKSANASGDLCTSNSFNASSQLAAGGSSMRRNGNWNEQQFPGFWQDAKRYRMHWVFYSFALMTLGSIICVAIVPALLVWAAIVPGLATVVLSVQYARYRWRRDKHAKQHPSSPRTLASAHTTAVARTSPSPTPPIDLNRAGNHAHRPSYSSMHTSVGSVGSDSFLGPHEPPHNLKSQFRHQYFHSLTPSSQASSPSRFAEGYTRHPHHPHSPQSPSPEYRQSWYTTQNHEKIPTRMIRRQDSSSSIASSETVSSSSTCSMVDSVVSRGARVTDHYPETLPGTLNSRSHEESLSQDQLESPMVPLPLPVYPSKTRDEEHRSFSEKVPALLDVVALPEIAPLGDLLSEFAVDFGPAQ